MKKIISFFMVFLICFSMFSRIDQKKPEAITLVAGYTIAQILGAMALSATVVGAGYAVSDTLVNPDDNSEFTDFLQTVFKQTMDLHKYEVPPPPEPLSNLESATLLSMLTKQGIEVGKDLYDMVYDYFNGEVEVKHIPEDNQVSVLNNLSYNPTGMTYRIISDYNLSVSTPKYLKRALSDRPNVIMYMHYSPELGHRFISQDNSIVYLPSGLKSVGIMENGEVWGSRTTAWNFSEFFGQLTFGPLKTEFNSTKEIPPDIVNEPLNLPSFSELTNGIFKNIDMSPLNGLVKDPDELIDIINGVKKVPGYVYGKITTAFNDIYNNFLENPNFIGADAPLSPISDPNTGTLYFGDPKLEEPEIVTDPMPDELSALNKALFWLKGIWQSIRDLPKNIAIEIVNIFQYLKNFIERFWQTFTEWWENNFLYHWTLFIEWLHTLPNLIANALTPLFDLLMIPINAIVSIANDIFEFLIELPGALIDLLKDLFIWLFVPDPEFLKDKVDIFKENFTFIDSFKQFILLFDDMTSQNRVPTITLDFSKFKGSLGGKPISMGGQAFVLDMRFYDAYRVIGDIMITAFVYLMFAWRFFSRLPEIISGGGLLYTADNKTNDIINKLEGKKK